MPALWVATAPLAGCDDDGADAAPAAFECTEEHDEWSQCADGMVQWCHASPGMDPHFHWGANCPDLGLRCVATSDREAVCVDDASSCSPGAHECDQGAARNCLPDGHWAVEPCSGTTVCHDGPSAAACEDECTSFDPQLACELYGAAPEAAQVTTDPSEVLSESFHAELNTAVQVTLPDELASYIHFPVTESGRYLVYLDADALLGTILDADGSDQTPAGGGPNDGCPSQLVDHYYVDLEYTGSGGEPVPFVLRFSPVPSRSVTFVLLRQCGLVD